MTSDGTVSRRVLLGGATAAGVAASVGTGSAARAGGGSLAVVGATVIDGSGRAPQHDATVLVRDGRIVAAGHHVPVPHDATVVDGSGRYLIPGLADMHAHSTELERVFPPLYIANGVTTVREMSANPGISALRDRVEAGELLGPRWTIGSLIIDGSPSLWDGIAPIYQAVANPAEARAAVRSQQAAGADFIKTYSRLTRESFLALAGEARRRGIPFLGHTPDFVQLTEASDAGLHTAEHLFQIWYDTARDERRLRRAIRRVPIGPGEYGGWFAKMHPIEYAAALGHDRGKAGRVFERLARNGTAVTPTLSVHRVSDLPEEVSRTDPRYRYFPAGLVAAWAWQMDEIFLARPAAQRPERRDIHRRRLPLVRELHEAGVPLLAGTDNNTAYVMAGFSLHDELGLLVRAGLSPMAALRAATGTAAEYLGGNAGLIRPGRDADLVLLDADPLRDIRNTTRIHSLVVRGRYVSPAERQRMLDDVLTAAQETTMTAAPARCAC